MKISDKVILGLSMVAGAAIGTQTLSKSSPPSVEAQGTKAESGNFESFYFNEDSVTKDPQNTSPDVLNPSEEEILPPGESENPPHFFCPACGKG